MENRVRHCSCSNNDNDWLIFSRAYVSRIIAGALILSFAIFATGYFFGSRHVNDMWMQNAHGESFSDAVAFSLQTEDFGNGVVNSERSDISPVIAEEQLPVSQILTKDETKTAPIEDVVRDTGKKYGAAVMGGKQSEVRSFIKKMAHYGVHLEERKRESRKKGDVYVWYQAVIPGMSEKADILRVINLIEKYGHLKNSITIVELKV